MLVAHVLTHDDRLSVGRVVGLVAGFIGVVVLIGPDLLTELGTHVLAELACLAAACFYAVRRGLCRGACAAAAGHDGDRTTDHVHGAAAAVVLLFDRPESLFTASRTAIWAMVSLALLSSALAYLIYFRLIARAGATNALIVTFLHSGQRHPARHRAAGRDRWMRGSSPAWPRSSSASPPSTAGRRASSRERFAARIREFSDAG